MLWGAVFCWRAFVTVLAEVVCCKRGATLYLNHTFCRRGVVDATSRQPSVLYTVQPRALIAADLSKSWWSIEWKPLHWTMTTQHSILQSTLYVVCCRAFWMADDADEQFYTLITLIVDVQWFRAFQKVDDAMSRQQSKNLIINNGTASENPCTVHCAMRTQHMTKHPTMAAKNTHCRHGVLQFNYKTLMVHRLKTTGLYKDFET